VPKQEKLAEFASDEPLSSPVREDSMINDSVKKKIENIEKEN